MENIQKIINLIDCSIKENPDNSLTAWNIIADWYNKEVDEYKNILLNSKNWLSDYQAKLIENTWITTLKIKFTNVAWYFIEVPKSQISKISDEFIQKQTLVNAARYITSELKDFESKFVEAEQSLSEIEYKLFQDIREEILDSYKSIKELGEDTAFLDFSSSMANVAYENNYTKPKMSEKYSLDIKWWRHAVIEQIEKDFISNDLDLNKASFVHTITWPNMWGKSTFLRQNALIILMAHIWSYVPAREANIPLTDRIFSRVWAQDNLFFWQSTFMVEMQEVANIINNSTEKSFVIIDEVWRWTSTYDGMSLAWAILKENHDNIKAKTLFATHYHELIDKAKTLKWVDNFSVAVWENEENLVFLRKIIPGWIKKSFWLEVAKLAWINKSILTEAKKMLKILELEHDKLWYNQLNLWELLEQKVKIVEKEVICKSKIEQELKNLDVRDNKDGKKDYWFRYYRTVVWSDWRIRKNGNWSYGSPRYNP